MNKPDLIIRLCVEQNIIFNISNIIILVQPQHMSFNLIKASFWY